MVSGRTPIFSLTILCGWLSSWIRHIFFFCVCVFQTAVPERVLIDCVSKGRVEVWEIFYFIFFLGFKKKKQMAERSPHLFWSMFHYWPDRRVSESLDELRRAVVFVDEDEDDDDGDDEE